MQSSPGSLCDHQHQDSAVGACVGCFMFVQYDYNRVMAATTTHPIQKKAIMKTITEAGSIL